MKVAVVGMGEIGEDIVEYLVNKKDTELVLIDQDEKRCGYLSNTFDALVLQGDATNPELLRKAEIQNADALIAVTGSDATNTVVAMLGHRMGIKKIMVKLNDVGLRAACREIGVSKIVAPKVAAASEIVSALYGLDRLDFSMVVQAGLQLVELDAGKATGKRMEELGFPEEARVVAVLRKREVLLPKGRLKLEEGDKLLTLVESNDAYSQAYKILSPEE